MKKNLPLLFLLMILVPFQNCSWTARDDGSVDLLSMHGFRLSHYADLAWSARGNSGLTVTSLDQVRRWTDQTNNLVALFPPLITGSSQPDLSRSPELDPSGRFVRFTENSHLTPQVSDDAFFRSDRYSIVFYVRNVSIPAGQSVRIFDLATASSAAHGWLALDLIDVGGGQFQVNAYSYFEGNSARISYDRFPANLLNQGLGVAVTFPSDPNQVRVAVNGTLATLLWNDKDGGGHPPAQGNVTRQLFLKSAGPSAGSFEMGEFGLWKRAMAEDELRYYSSTIKASFEGKRITEGPPPVGNPTDGKIKFSSVQGHFSSCTGCHNVSSRGSVLENRNSSGSPWVTPGNAGASRLIKALRHESGAAAMPQGGSPLSPAAIDAVAAWIDDGAL